MAVSTMQQLADLGQSVWLDYISRPLLETGQLKKLIDQGLRGMTSNPSIFNSAIASSKDYDEKILKLKSIGKSTFEIYDELTVKDIQDACDQFKGVFEKTKGLDGYVSLEINPLLANKVDEQTKEGIRLFKKVNRPNCMIKVPSTEEGFPVFEELINQGINVNVTLIFSLEQYEKTAQAYLKGLAKRQKRGEDLSKIRSVASVFVSRIDTLIDGILTDKQAHLKGKAAVANSHIIYERAKEVFAGAEFKALAKSGANVQRVLWGSTSTKNPIYPDIKYVTELIAPLTVNTIPEKTLYAFLDHGTAQNALTYPVAESKKIIRELKKTGIDITEVCQKLLVDGCKAFDKAFEDLQASIEKKAAQLVESK